MGCKWREREDMEVWGDGDSKRKDGQAAKCDRLSYGYYAALKSRHVSSDKLYVSGSCKCGFRSPTNPCTH